MACGDRLRYFAVTASGLNLSNPYDDVPSFTDYEEWLALARRLALLAQSFHDVLGDVEEAALADAPGGTPFELWNAVDEVKKRMAEGLDALPSPFLNFNPAGNIADATAVVLDALCVVEMSEDGIVSLGGKPPTLPSTPTPHENDGIGTTTKNAITTLVLIGGGLAALLLFARKRR